MLVIHEQKINVDDFFTAEWKLIRRKNFNIYNLISEAWMLHLVTLTLDFPFALNFIE